MTNGSSACHMYLGSRMSTARLSATSISHSGICRVLDHVVGACVPFWDGAYKCMQSMFVVKPPGGAGSPWHQDEHPIPTRDRSLTGVWIALADATVANGCLRILPDSHRSGVIYERFAHDLPDVDSNPVARGFDETGAIPIEMPAGSVLFFSGYLLHSSPGTRATGTARPSTFHYCSASTWLTWGGEQNFRGVVQVRGEDPYADLGYTTPQPWVKER